MEPIWPDFTSSSAKLEISCDITIFLSTFASALDMYGSDVYVMRKLLAVNSCNTKPVVADCDRKHHSFVI